jgi:hypothetical protein
MQAEGYGADIAFDGSTIRITGKGLGKGALGASDREIPVSALRAIDFKPASALVNGHIELVTDQGKTLVHFRRKHGDSMSAVYRAIAGAVPHAHQGMVKAPAQGRPPSGRTVCGCAPDTCGLVPRHRRFGEAALLGRHEVDRSLHRQRCIVGKRCGPDVRDSISGFASLGSARLTVV